MLAVEELLSELEGEETRSMKTGLPPGFRFHPTDEELITFYLASKVFTGGFCGVDIVEVDLHKYEPWELPDAAKMGEREWYFFNLRDRKYPTGLRTNRATEAGYWKATGKDKQVYSSSSSGSSSSTSANNNNFDCNINVASSSTSSTSALLLGMKKTLVFYKGRAPRGVKTKWVMHEYRLAGHFSSRHTCQEEWVICRIFYKNGEKKVGDQQVQGQAYATSPNTFGSLPPLLEAPASTILGDDRSQFCTQQEPTIQNHFMIVDQHNEDNYLKSLLHLNSLVSDFNVSAINGLFPQPSLSTTAISVPITISTTTGATEAAAAATTTTNKRMGTNTNSSSSSSSVSHLLSHQDCTFKEEYPVLKQCKTETTYSQFQVPVYDANNLNLKWMDNYCCHNPNPSPWTDPLSSFLEMDRNVLSVSSSAPASTTPAVDTSADETSSSMAFYGNCSQIPTDPMVNLGPHQIRN